MPADVDGPRPLKGVQYPFAVNEKVLIKVNFFVTSLSSSSCYSYCSMMDLQRNSADGSKYTGKQEDPWQVCWKGSSDHIPTLEWLVSLQGFYSFKYIMCVIINLLAGISSRFLTVEKVCAFNTVLSRNSCSQADDRAQPQALLQSSWQNRIDAFNASSACSGHEVPLLGQLPYIFWQVPRTCFSFGSFFLPERRKRRGKVAAKSLKSCKNQRPDSPISCNRQRVLHLSLVACTCCCVQYFFRRNESWC